ncbi:hypothetical protein CCACVL1_23144 [Corchorus capsularis]|uniref:non-specific serine/threonine protein kinase n=2 Tax=Corchorus TaxID=93758 RepID=A0A1R3GUY8_COCAP|nr:hypothetical protein CCACVL1_23144 [Corchorus capsularis]
MLKKRVITVDDFPWRLPSSESPQEVEQLKYVGGVDVSFSKNEPSLACGSLVVLDLHHALDIVYQDYVVVTIDVPYVTGFLAFREAPILVNLLEKMKSNASPFYPQVLMVDGNGLLHPRGFGLASHLGVLANLPTIGIGKKLHHVDGLTRSGVKKLLEGGENGAKDVITLRGNSGFIWGAAIRSTQGSLRPLFVSTGHRVSLDTAIKIVNMTCRFRVPEPIRQVLRKVDAAAGYQHPLKVSNLFLKLAFHPNRNDCSNDIAVLRHILQLKIEVLAFDFLSVVLLGFDCFWNGYFGLRASIQLKQSGIGIFAFLGDSPSNECQESGLSRIAYSEFNFWVPSMIGKMVEGPKFTGLMGATNNNDNNYYDFTQGFYQKLGEGTNMSIDSLQTSNAGGSVSMSIENSSVGSNDSLTHILSHPGLKPVNRHNYSVSVGQSVFRPGKVGHALNDDALAQALMDSRYPTQGLENYDEWTIDLRKLNMGTAFAQGAFGKLYRGTYNGEDVAIKILERPENSPEKAQVMEQQFQQEVMMLATLKHPNIVRFIGACRKPMVWCIVTEYAKGGSVRQFLTRRQNRAVPLKLAVKQALDVARGMAYVHGLGFIHRDLKSDNLLIAADKSIKIADFGVARIEVQTEGMTPETGTYRWMAPEMIQHRPYTQKVDVYSFGIVLWELITGLLPFQNMTAVQAAFAVVNKGVRPVIPNDCLPVLSEIMTRCWDTNPEVRPPFTEIVKMLENAETEIMTTVRKARFRCCMTQPMTID